MPNKFKHTNSTSYQIFNTYSSIRFKNFNVMSYIPTKPFNYQSLPMPYHIETSHFTFITNTYVHYRYQRPIDLKHKHQQSRLSPISQAHFKALISKYLFNSFHSLTKLPFQFLLNLCQSTCQTYNLILDHHILQHIIPICPIPYVKQRIKSTYYR